MWISVRRHQWRTTDDRIAAREGPRRKKDAEREKRIGTPRRPSTARGNNEPVPDRGLRKKNAGSKGGKI